MLRFGLLTVCALLTVPLGTANAASERVKVRDPGGRGTWVGSLSSGSGGSTCATIRRTGSAGVRGRFCSSLNRSNSFLYGVYHRTSAFSRGWRTVYVVAFDRSVVRARLSVPGRTVRYRRGRHKRLMVVVVKGFTERGELRVDVATGGRVITVRSRPLGVQTADPGGGVSWRAVPDRAARGAAGCVRWERVPPRFRKTPQPARGPERCGRADKRLVIAAAEVVAAADRTVVTGLAGDEVRSLRVRAPDGDRSLTLDAETGTFVGVIGSEVQSDTLELVLTLADGSEVVRPVGVSG